ncbi:MAG: hypothetical protein ACLT38_00305 [Akkermansia sp.]
MPPVLPLMKKPVRLCLAAGTLFALFLAPLAQGRTWTNLQGKNWKQNSSGWTARKPC